MLHRRYFTHESKVQVNPGKFYIKHKIHIRKAARVCLIKEARPGFISKDLQETMVSSQTSQKYKIKDKESGSVMLVGGKQSAHLNSKTHTV